MVEAGFIVEAGLVVIAEVAVGKSDEGNITVTSVVGLIPP